MQSIQKVKNYIGLERRGGYLIIGQDKLDGYEKKLYLILLDKTAGKSSAKTAQKHKERNIKILEIENLGVLCGVENCKILGVKNKGLSEQIEKNIGIN